MLMKMEVALEQRCLLPEAFKLSGLVLQLTVADTKTRYALYSNQLPECFHDGQRSEKVNSQTSTSVAQQIKFCLLRALVLTLLALVLSA